MPKVTKRVAAKDYPHNGISKGDEYYYWAIKLQRGGLVRRSKTYPKRSQLTMSDFLGPAYDLDDAIADCTSPDDLRALADDVRTLGGEQQDKLDNMPEGLQQGSTGEMIQERVDNCESWADEIEAASDALENAISEIDDAEANPSEDDGEREYDRERADALRDAIEASGMQF